jgi:hypothetical protein
MTNSALIAIMTQPRRRESKPLDSTTKLLDARPTPSRGQALRGHDVELSFFLTLNDLI